MLTCSDVMELPVDCFDYELHHLMHTSPKGDFYPFDYSGENSPLAKFKHSVLVERGQVGTIEYAITFGSGLDFIA